MEPLSNKTNLEDKEGVSFCCQHCGQEVVICRSCWRNQKYCSSQCSKQAYLLRHRKNQKKYNESDKGRESHKERQRRYRENLTFRD